MRSRRLALTTPASAPATGETQTSAVERLSPVGRMAGQHGTAYSAVRAIRTEEVDGGQPVALATGNTRGSCLTVDFNRL